MNDPEPCGACNGHGIVRKLFGRTGNAGHVFMPCEVCGGRGYILALQIKPTKPAGKASRL